MDQIIKRFPNVGFIAHRGLPSKQLENTKESFLEAAKFGFFGIETDLHLTMDKIAVLHHDDNLQTFSNYDLKINETNFDKIKSIKLNQNYSIPTLEDYINICKTYHKKAVIELKSHFLNPDLLLIIDLVNKYNYLESTIFISFHLDSLILLRKQLPNVHMQYLTDNFDHDVLKSIVKYQFDLSIHYSALTKAIIDTLHHLNLKVGAWTVNDKPTMIKLIHLGVDYITTDGFK